MSTKGTMSDGYDLTLISAENEKQINIPLFDTAANKAKPQKKTSISSEPFLYGNPNGNDWKFTQVTLPKVELTSLNFSAGRDRRVAPKLPLSSLDLPENPTSELALATKHQPCSENLTQDPEAKEPKDQPIEETSEQLREKLEAAIRKACNFSYSYAENYITEKNLHRRTLSSDWIFPDHLVEGWLQTATSNGIIDASSIIRKLIVAHTNMGDKDRFKRFNDIADKIRKNLSACLTYPGWRAEYMKQLADHDQIVKDRATAAADFQPLLDAVLKYNAAYKKSLQKPKTAAPDSSKISTSLVGDLQLTFSHRSTSRQDWFLTDGLNHLRAAQSTDDLPALEMPASETMSSALTQDNNQPQNPAPPEYKTIPAEQNTSATSHKTELSVEAKSTDNIPALETPASKTISSALTQSNNQTQNSALPEHKTIPAEQNAFGTSHTAAQPEQIQARTVTLQNSSGGSQENNRVSIIPPLEQRDWKKEFEDFLVNHPETNIDADWSDGFSDYLEKLAETESREILALISESELTNEIMRDYADYYCGITAIESRNEMNTVTADVTIPLRPNPLESGVLKIPSQQQTTAQERTPTQPPRSEQKVVQPTPAPIGKAPNPSESTKGRKIEPLWKGYKDHSFKIRGGEPKVRIPASTIEQTIQRLPDRRIKVLSNI